MGSNRLHSLLSGNKTSFVKLRVFNEFGVVLRVFVDSMVFRLLLRKVGKHLT